MNIAYTEAFSRNLFLDRGLSDAADQVRRIRNDESAASSFYSIHANNLILNGLKSALADAANDNLDGYHKFRTNSNTLLYALTFLNLLPTSTPFPDIAIDNDGEIAIEWDFGPRRIISIRVGKDGTLNFASLVGYSSNHGVETLQDRIPDTILLGINRVIDTSST